MKRGRRTAIRAAVSVALLAAAYGVTRLVAVREAAGVVLAPAGGSGVGDWLLLAGYAFTRLAAALVLCVTLGLAAADAAGWAYDALRRRRFKRG